MNIPEEVQVVKRSLCDNATRNDISNRCRRVERVGDVGEQAPTAGDQFAGRGLESLALVGDAILVGVVGRFLLMADL